MKLPTNFILSLVAGSAGALILETTKLPFWQAVPGIALLLMCGRIMEDF